MNYQETLEETKVKSLFSQRYVEFLQAGLDWTSLETINYNVVHYQQTNGTLRTDRLVEKRGAPKESTESKVAYERRATPHFYNMSDAKILKQLDAFRAEHSLDMDETEEQWYEYITTGQIGAAVSEGLAAK